MIRVPIKAPNLPKTLSNGSISMLRNETQIEQLSFDDQKLEGLIISSLVLDQVSINSCSLEQCQLAKLQLSDSVFKHCTVISANWSDSGIVRTRFEQSRLSGFDLNGAAIQDVSFIGCKLDLANFRLSKLTRCEFVDCDLSEIDFYAAELKQVSMTNCNLTKAQFSCCKAAAVDLRGSDISGLNGLLSLKGATISSTQAMLLGPKALRELGIMIEID